MKKIFLSILFSCFFLPSYTSCSSGSEEDGKKPEPETPTNEDKEKYACIFYFSGYGDGFMNQTNIAPSTDDCWIMEGQEPKFGGLGSINWWGKPFWAGVNENGNGKIKDYYRFYFNGDPNQVNEELLNWHADLLTDADIDIAVLDFTNAAADYAPNGPYYISATKALCKCWQERLRKNLKTPKIVFFFNNQAALQRIEQEFFNVYDKELFFNYLGKKFILCADPGFEKRGGVDDRWDITLSPAVPTEGIYGNYTTRHCWGLLADNPNVGPGKYWTFKELMLDPLPTPFYYRGEPEQLCVTTACASYNNGTIHGVGRENGATFQKFMNKAKQVQPKFVFIHSWNEWNAANQSANGGHFIDQYIDTHSSDIEPMWGGHGFKYYDLMRKNLAEYKGFTFCDPIASGKTFIFIPKQSRKALSSINNKIVQSQRLANESSQQWEVTMVADGIYTIKNKKNNKYLSEQESDGSVIESNTDTGDSQLWKFETVTDGYYKITNKKSNRFLEIEASSLKNNANIICSTEKVTDDNILWELSLVK